jgi:protein phosphatase PTC7
LSAVCNIPHDDKRYKGGEDAFTTSPKLIAVADGVGGWADRGVDPGLFSKQLCKDIQAIFDKNAETKYSLKQILIEAVKRNKHMGSSTACLAMIDADDKLKTTNLGDSGYVIFRSTNGKIEKIFRSKEQQYSFNFPYQCGSGCELPTNAFDNEHEIFEHDLIVMGTDGVLDNVFDEDI